MPAFTRGLQMAGSDPLPLAGDTMTYKELRRRLRMLKDQDAHAGEAVRILLGFRVEGAHEGMTIRQLRWKLFADIGDDKAPVDPGVIGTLMAAGPIGIWDCDDGGDRSSGSCPPTA